MLLSCGDRREGCEGVVRAALEMIKTHSNAASSTPVGTFQNGRSTPIINLFACFYVPVDLLSLLVVVVFVVGSE